MSVSFAHGMLRVEINVTEFNRAKKAISMVNDRGTYRGMFRDEIKRDLVYLTWYAKQITHKQTGVLALAHTWEYDSHRMKGKIFIGDKVSWLSGSTIRRPHIYGVYEHARGGSHAFYERTAKEAAPKKLPDGLRAAVKGLRWP